MKNFLSICIDPKIISICIGKFDGMHLAHQELFKKLHQDCSLILSIVELDEAKMLTPNKQELTSLPICYLELNEIREMGIEEFVHLLRAHLPNLKKIVVGYDFRFGKNRIYQGEDLRRFFEVCIIDEVRWKGEAIHTGVIIEALLQGDMARANAMLGRAYCVQGSVICGQGIGQKRLVATINLDTQNYILPQEGVYVSYSEIEGRRYKSVTFIGRRLSTDLEFSVETHLIGEHLSSAPMSAKIYFIQKIRDNQKFPSLQDLNQQIKKDIQEALIKLR